MTLDLRHGVDWPKTCRMLDAGAVWPLDGRLKAGHDGGGKAPAVAFFSRHGRAELRASAAREQAAIHASLNRHHVAAL